MHMKSFIFVLMLIACFAGTAQSPSPAFAAEPVNIGVIAFPTKPQALAQWQPLTVVLKQAMPERDFVVIPLSHGELDRAVAARQLDFVMTNGGHYLLLRNRNGLSSPLATLASNGTGHSLTVFGGVIFSRAGQAEINTLNDIKGKTVAAVQTESQGGYQMQAYELSRVEINLPQDVQLSTTGFPHAQVVEAVLAGDAEVGFVRSGVLEKMVREGRLDIKQLKILNRQDLPGFPLLVSTRLYPEWPFAAMPHIAENLARRVAATLLSLEENTVAARAMGIHGFVVPADYSLMEDVLRELRIPPFDLAPRFTLHDVWARYRWQNEVALLAVGVIFLLGMSVLAMYRRLAASHQLVLLHQHKLQESEEKFRTLVESTSDWIWEVDQSGRYTYVSPRVEALLGYKPEEILGKSPLDLMLPEEAQRVGKIFGEIIGKHLPLVSLENTNLHKDGRLVDLETSGVPFFDPNGEFAGYRGIDRDITERKQTAQALTESEHRFKTILDATMDGILVADGQSKMFVTGNNAICDMLGYEMAELTRLGVEDIHPAKSLLEVQRQFERQMKGEISVAPSLPVQRKDGSVFYADVSSAPMVLAERPLLVGVFHDVTERKQVEEKIRTLNDELEEKVQKRTQLLLAAQEDLVRKEKLALLGQVAGSVGHELRNPLGVMNNAVYFLQTVLTDADETTREYLNIIQNGVADADRIVADLLDSVRTKEPQPAAIGVGELIDQTLHTLTVPDTITVNLDIPETLPSVWVDGRQIQQVFRNLIGNSVEAMVEGGTLAINALANSREGTVSVSVRDTGCGIGPEMLDRLFQPLFTTKARGIGLGMMVVKNLTEANGGSVKVESEVGKGSVFSVTLPGDIPAEVTA
ncbi:MAG: PAS domain S-box protein [Desulfobulbaceae bacterium]|jgi:PAS domain S-box-containing protein|nr:PAS domain S-box protein [Desulfobulbaceae bacterium]